MLPVLGIAALATTAAVMSEKYGETLSTPWLPAWVAAQDFVAIAKQADIATLAPTAIGTNHVSVPVHPSDWLEARAKHGQIFLTLRQRHQALPFFVSAPDGKASVTFTTDPYDLKRMAMNKGLAVFLLGSDPS